MRYVSFDSINLNHVKIFIDAAESQSFSATAQRLSYTQSMVSKTIALLEKELGLVLFFRTKHGVSLTPAGQSLHAEWRSIYRHFEDSVEKAHVIQTGMLSSISIGSVSTLAKTEELELLVKIFTENNPSVALSYEEYTLSDLLQLASEKKLDCIITSLHDTPSLEEHGYEWKLLFETHLTAFVHVSNPLAKKAQIAFEDLAAEEFIVLSPSENPNYISMLVKLCAAHGFAPKISVYVSNPHSFKGNILKGEGIVLADSATDIQHPEIIRLVLPDHPSGLVAAWLKDTGDENVQKLISLIKTIADE